MLHLPIKNLLLDAGMLVAAAIPSVDVPELLLTAFGVAVSLCLVEILASMTAEELSIAAKVKREPAEEKTQRQPSH